MVYNIALFRHKSKKVFAVILDFDPLRGYSIAANRKYLYIIDEKENQMSSRLTNVTYLDIVRNVWSTFKDNHSWNSYASILALSAYARVGKFGHHDDILEESVGIAGDYLNGKVERVGGAYDNYIYRVGGSASAWLFARGYLAGADEKLIKAAEKLINEFPRSPEGAFCWLRHNPLTGKDAEIVWTLSLPSVRFWSGLAKASAGRILLMQPSNSWCSITKYFSILKPKFTCRRAGGGNSPPAGDGESAGRVMPWQK